MEPKRKKEKLEDRISELPDSLLHYIFSFMDVVDVLKTCSLSKRWRYLWTSLPYLNFNFLNYRMAAPKRINWEFIELDFVNFINQVIVRRDSIPIIKFSYHSDDVVKPRIVESWICYAIKHNVQQLQVLISGDCETTVELRRCLYGCESLRMLEMDGFVASIQLPASFGLPNLKSLCLKNFSEFDGKIFSSCPNLQTLKLENIGLYGIQSFSICAPNLKTLDIFLERESGTEFSEARVTIEAPKLTKFKYDGPCPFFCNGVNLVSLDEVEIIVDDPIYIYLCFWPSEVPEKQLATRMLDMLDQFHNAKSMTLSFNVIKCLSVIPSLLNERSSPFSNLKCLKVKNDRGSKSQDVSLSSYFLNYFLRPDGDFQFQML